MNTAEMATYIGTKIIKAVPETKDEAEKILGRAIGAPGSCDGYLVQYEDGYLSWSPKDVFDQAYRPIKGMTFGLAIEALRKGLKVARAGWNGKGMWLALSPGTKSLPAEKFWAGPNHAYAEAQGGAADVLPSITIKTATGEILMGWLASQTDMLAEDWEIVQ